MKPYQERVIQEKRELDEKKHKLKVFLETLKPETVSNNEHARLLKQYAAMVTYSGILGDRIANFI